MKFWEAMKALQNGLSVRRIDLNEPIHPCDIESSEYEMDLTTEWELCEVPFKTCSIMEAIAELKKGKKIKRKHWKNPNSVLHLEKAASGTWSPIFIDEKGHPVGLYLDDIEADDWVVCE